MPGLLRGVARTAVIAGTATHVSNNVSRRQARRWGNQDAETTPAEATPQDDSYVEIEKLAQLKDNGVLTQEEFEAKKRQILGI